MKTRSIAPGFFVDASLEFKLYRAAISKVDFNYYEPWSTAPFTIVTRLSEGELLRNFKDTGAEIIIRKGQASYCPADAMRSARIISTGGSVCHWSHFKFSYMSSIDFLSLFKVPLVFEEKAADKVGEITLALVELLNREDGSPFVRLARQKLLGFKMLDIILSVSKIKPEAKDAIATANRLLPALRIMQERFPQGLNIDGLAASSRMSRSSFHYQFKILLGLSPMEYVRNLRVEKAKELLLSTDLTIGEISGKVGFEDQFHFSRVFRKSAGVSPKFYRTRERNIF